MTTAKRVVRVKKSFSISVEAQSYVRKVRKERKIASDSETLDLLLKESMAARRRSSVDAAYKAYYDSVSVGELAEEAEWASFAESELVEVSQ